jgi:hypothetical protein
MQKKEVKIVPLTEVPVLSLTAVERLIASDMNSSWPYIVLAMAKLMALFPLPRDKEEKMETALLDGRSVEDKKLVQATLEEIKRALNEARKEQQRVFYSLDDAVDYMIEEKSVPAKLVKAMLGGQWPDHPFGFECIGSYMMKEDGTLVPDDGTGIEAPGPDFKLEMIDFMP